MKNILLTAVFFLLLSPLAIGQVERPPVDKFQQFINEAYTGEGVEQIAPTTARYAFMKKMYEERIVYTEYPANIIADKGYKKLSEVELYTSYNEALQRDANFNPSTFNPFKYSFPFFDLGTQVYVVDGTNTVIIIYPQTIRPTN